MTLKVHNLGRLLGRLFCRCWEHWHRGLRSSSLFLANSVMFMASGIFIGLNEDELLAIRVKALASITSGTVTMSYSDSGSSVSRQFAGMTPAECLSEAMYALSILDPQTYGTVRTVLRGSFRRQDF